MADELYHARFPLQIATVGRSPQTVVATDPEVQ